MAFVGVRRRSVAAYRWGERLVRRRITPTVAYRTHERYASVRGSRHAASMTYYGFLSLFPLIALAVTIVAATLGDTQIDRIETELQENLPGIADQVPISSMVAHAGTIGLLGALVLLYSGLGWVGATRAAVRTLWGVDDDPGNVVVRKLADLASLVGLGIAMALSVAATTLATGVAQFVLHWLGLHDTSGAAVLLGALGLAVGVALGMVLFGYLLSGISRIHLPRRRLLLTSFVGAVGFEILKLGIGSYLEHIATRNLYGAFGTPIALLLWINLVARLLLYCAAWAAVKAERPAIAVVPTSEEPRQGGTRRDGGERGREREQDQDQDEDQDEQRASAERRAPAAGPRSATAPQSWPAVKPRRAPGPPHSGDGRAAAVAARHRRRRGRRPRAV